MSLIKRSSATRSWFASAFAAADSISLRMSWAALRVEKRSSARASSSGMPRTWLATGRSAGLLGSALGLATFFAAGFLAADFFAAGFFAADFFAAAFAGDFFA